MGGPRGYAVSSLGTAESEEELPTLTTLNPPNAETKVGQ